MKAIHKLLGALGAVVLAAAMLAPIAAAETPATGYSQFAGCPSPKSELSFISTCIRSEITSGRLKLGNKDTPITQPIILSGGTDTNLERFSYNSKGGLSKAKQKVPGGVVGLTGLTWLLELLGSEALTLYAVAELAGTPVLKNTENIQLPLKVHLENGTLGNNCYVGSTSSPVVLNLTTGTSGKLTGHAPTYKFDPTLEILHATGGEFVDGTFTAPGASGCVLTLFGFIPISINGLVNTASGLPAGSGTNETQQVYNLEVAESELVYP